MSNVFLSVTKNNFFIISELTNAGIENFESI